MIKHHILHSFGRGACKEYCDPAFSLLPSMQSRRFHSPANTTTVWQPFIRTHMAAIKRLAHTCSPKAHFNEACSQSFASRQGTLILLMKACLTMFNDYHDTDSGFKKMLTWKKKGSVTV